MRKWKRFLCMVFCVVMLFTMMPILCTQSSAAEAWLWPLAGCQIVLSNFGYRDLDGDGELDWSDPHRGIDIIRTPQDSTRGLPVRATKSGTIITSINTCTHVDYKGNCGCNGGAGNYIVIRHTDGTYSRYLHMLQTGLHGEGYVSQGETIGYVGTSGWSYGYHLHFELLDNNWNLMNPMPTNSEITIWNEYSIPSDWPSQKTTYVFEEGPTDDTTPEKPVITGLGDLYLSNEPITIQWTYGANTTHCNYWLYKKDGDEWNNINRIDYATSPVTETLDTGDYRVLVVATNSNAGWVWTASDYAYFSVVDLEYFYPEKPVVIGLAASYLPYQPVTIRWNYGANTTHCNYWLYKEDGGSWVNINRIDYAESPVMETLDVGEYRVLIVATNSNVGWIWTASDYAYFSVVPRVTFDPNGGFFTTTEKSFALSGINTPRDEHQLVAYTGDGATVDTNCYGFEVAVNNQGEVTAERSYGDETHLTIPVGGFVLSGDGDNSSPNADFVAQINIGDYLAYDAASMMAYHYTNYDEYLSQQKRVESTYGNLPIPTKDGYYFNGWVGENGQAIDYYTEFSSANLTAQWADDDTSPAAEVTYNGHKYLRYEYNMTWNSAKNFCEAHGGHLVTITSDDEQNAVESLLSGGRNLIYFTGCSDMANHGTWTWITGEPFSYNNWDPQLPEPSGSEQGFNYGGIVNKAIGGFKQFGEWLSNANYPDELNAYQICNYGFICEIDTVCEHDYASVVTAPTCTEQGYTTYTCSKCGDSYVDNYIPALEHNYQAVVTNPSCTAQGYTTHTCSRCGDIYVDTYVDALGHDYELTGWQWTGYTAAKATFTCKNDSAHVQMVNATITNNRTEPTCEAPGKVVYTAKVTYEGKDFTDTKTQTLDALDHNWNTPTYTWATDNSTVTATRICMNDTSHVETETVNTSSAVTTPATCTTKGKTTYTATFTNSAFATQTKTVENVPALGHTPAVAVKENETTATCTETGGYDMVTTCAVCGTELKREHTDVPALGHDWGEWCPIPMNFCTDPRIEDRTCNRCGATESRTLPPDGHTPGEPVKENDLAPTCEVAGGYDMVVYCTVCGAEITCEHTDIAALGHDWNEPEYVWADDYSIVTATRTCKNDASHKETETVNTTSEVIKEATYDEEGEIVYTATFENEAFAAQTKTVATPKLDGPKPYEPCDGGDDCPGNVFTDMPAKGNWAHDAIDWAIVNKITAGTSATIFSPNAGCTRAQVVTFLWRAAGSPEPTSTNNPFTDVKEETYYYKAVLWAIENKVTAGTSATTFSPDATCTRAQIVTFLWRFEGEPASTTANNPFTDVKTGAYYEKAVLWASETGVTAGTSATAFSPDATCTRAQVVTFLYRDIEN